MGVDEILDQGGTSIIDVGIDAMGGQGLALGGEAAADVAADLTDGHRQSAVGHRRLPQSQVVALENIITGPLHRQVLGAAEQVQRADRRHWIGISRDGRADHPPRGIEIDAVGEGPAAAGQCGEDIGE